MKLIELLARELKEWPEGYTRIVQTKSDYVLPIDDDPVYHDGTQWDYVDPSSRIYDARFTILELATDYETAIVTRADWENTINNQPHEPVTPTLETMLAEWRDLEARAQAAQAEADALFEHAGQCHGEICVRLAELGWGAPRVADMASEPVVEEPVLTDRWWQHVKIGDMLTYQVGDGKYHCAGEFTHGKSYQVTNLDENDDSYPWELQSCPDLEFWGSPDYFTPSAQQ